MSTGVKILALITLALLPLGIIALLASLQSTRSADLLRRSEVRVAATESARRVGTELASDIAALKEATISIAAGQPSADVCEKAAAKLSARSGNIAQFALFGSGGDPLCATPGYHPRRPPLALIEARPTARVTEDAVEVTVLLSRSTAAAIARYPSNALADFARLGNFATPYALRLDSDSDSLPLIVPKDALSLSRETVEEPVGILGLSLVMTAEGATFGATEAILTFLPLLMWAAAAMIGFLVVDRLLIRPLKGLREAVRLYVPGQGFRLGDRTPAIEIRELGETFVTFADNLAHRETELAQALENQVKLTREVHHRVKNNLQVIASLISLHARSAPTPEASAAYASIQRRVDALSIVHRNHYAGLDGVPGIHLRTLLSELAANLKASASPASPSISVSAPPFYFDQDAAIPISFLLTELTELSMVNDPKASLTIAVSEAERSAYARVVIRSEGLRAPIAPNYARVIEGLARQLRSPLNHDAETGSYSIEFPAFAAP